jgi:hypothetical protein
LLCAILAGAGCGDPAPGTAAAPDAALCSSCTPAQTCAQGCTCPGFDLSPFPQLDLLKLEDMLLPPLVLAVGAFHGDDGEYHAPVFAYHPTETAVGSAIDLTTTASGGSPYIGFGYRVDLLRQTPLAVYRSVAGTIQFSRRCQGGAAAIAHDVVLREITGTGEIPIFLEGGCELTIPEVAIDIGDPCP